MKNVVISADGDRMVYAVPDIVADNLEKYCMEFCKWLETSPDAKEYWSHGVIYFGEANFIQYLNRWVFPQEISYPVENLGWAYSKDSIPEQYRGCPDFNF